MMHPLVRAAPIALAASLLAAPSQPPAADAAPDAALAAATAANRCGTGEGVANRAGTGKAVLVPGLTPVHMPVSANNRAQAFFDQGLGQLWGFDYDEALKSFQEAGRIDPDCAMCAWGEALALGPYMNSGAVDPALIVKARALVAGVLARPGLPPRDHALAEALHARYAPDGPEDGVHGAAYADLMTALARRWPADDLLAIMAAEAIMTSQPWDYWQADGRTPKARAGTALALVDQVLARNPDHPQAIHLLIHLTEASAAPERAAGPAARLERVAPAAPHMVHMPSHTWYRLGRFADSVAANQRAVAADEAYARAVGDDPRHYGYFNHHTHFILSSALQIGDAATALRAADALEASITADRAAATPFAEVRRLAGLQARLQLLTPAEVLALPAPDPRLRLTSLLWHGGRAEAAARSGDLALARAELASIRAARAGLKPGRDGDDPRSALITLIDGSARAALLAAEGRTDAALRLYRALEAVEARLPYREPPLWPVPIAASAGRLRLAVGDRAGAHADFTRALALRPGSKPVLDGLAAARRGQQA